MRKLPLILLLVFAGALSAQKKKLYVADQVMACMKNPNGCMQVKEKSKGEWQSMVDTIEGFAYQEGYNYTLKVEQLANTANGAHYKLLKVLKQKKSDFNPASRLPAKRWYLQEMVEDTTFIRLMDTSAVYIELKPADMSFSGHGLCNNFHGILNTDGSQISLTQIVSTKMACKGTLLESIVTTMLADMHSFKVVGDKLTLAGGNKAFMQFRSKDVHQH